jgi:hypothetical protein
MFMRFWARPLLAALLSTILPLGVISGRTKNKKDGEHGVRLTVNESAQRVDITTDGKPFTSYIWPDTIKKPVLYPLRASTGTIVTRGFPLNPRPGERVDHPHHVGLWFNYGNVNGVDFWNNSDSVKPDPKHPYGTIIHRKIVKTVNGKDRGELDVQMDWIMPDGKPILREETKFIFHAGPNLRSIDRITKLTALDKKALLNDDKEGVIGMRVARSLELPADKPEIFTDSSGKATSVPKLDNTGVTGMYLSSEGLKGDAVWGTRGRWVMLTGTVDQQPVTLAIVDHPGNPGFPTYWHARGYGLFAANPLGQAALSNGKERLNFSIEPGQSATFRYRVLILAGTATTSQIEAEYKEFAGEVE